MLSQLSADARIGVTHGTPRTHCYHCKLVGNSCEPHRLLTGIPSFTGLDEANLRDFFREKLGLRCQQGSRDLMLFLCLFTLHSHPSKNLSHSNILSKRHQEGLDHMSPHVASSSQGNCVVGN